MDLGVLLESPQGSQSASLLAACTCALLPAVAAVSRFPLRGSRVQELSLEAFRRGFTTGTSGNRSGGLRKGQSPCELLAGLSGFLSRRCQGLRSCVESVPKPEDSSPVLTWILRYFWSLPRKVILHLEWGHAHAISYGAVAAVSRFPSRGSRDLWLSLEAFPHCCSTCHRGVSRSSA